MTAVRRLAPLSLVLSVLMLAGSASAAPVGKGIIGSVKSAIAARMALGAANKDIESFFAEKGNADLRPALVKGMRGMVAPKVLRAASLAGAATSAGLSLVTGDGAYLAFGALFAANAIGPHLGIQLERRAAYTTAVKRAGARVDAARLKGWIDAGAINDFTK